MKFTSAALSILITALHDPPDGDADVAAVLTGVGLRIDTNLGTNPDTDADTDPDADPRPALTPTPTSTPTPTPTPHLPEDDIDTHPARYRSRRHRPA
jgi:hypothetical protein